MKKRGMVTTTLCLLVVGCGSGGAPSDPEAGVGGVGGEGGASGGAAASGGAGGEGGAAGGATPSGGGRWSDLPGGEGEQADAHQATCERQCENDAACDFRDISRCVDDCADPRRRCQADLFTASCWKKLMAWRDCVYALDCDALDHYYYRASTPDRPCTSEIDAFSAECPTAHTAFYVECFGEDLECPTGRERQSVPAIRICDRMPDCSDGSDEDPDLCTWRSE